MNAIRTKTHIQLDRIKQSTQRLVNYTLCQSDILFSEGKISAPHRMFTNGIFTAFSRFIFLLSFSSLLFVCEIKLEIKQKATLHTPLHKRTVQSDEKQPRQKEANAKLSFSLF